jgi:hypothetical protein
MAVIPQSEFPALLGEIFSLASQAGLAIDQIGYQPKELEGQGLLRYGLAFSVHGDYGQVKRFIYSLEQSERLFVIDGLTLSGGQEAGEATVELRLQLRHSDGSHEQANCSPYCQDIFLASFTFWATLRIRFLRSVLDGLQSSRLPLPRCLRQRCNRVPERGPGE